MHEDTARKARFWYGIFLSALTLLLAFLFAAETADLYYSRLSSGEDIYSRAVVGERLAALSIPFALFAVAAVGGYILSVLYPVSGNGRRKSDPRTMLAKLEKRIPAGTGEEFAAARKKYDKYVLARFIVWTFAALFAVASAVAAIVYLSGTSHFAAADISAEILGLVRNVLPWVGVSFLLFLGASLFERLAAPKALENVKQLIVTGNGAPMSEVSPFKQRLGAVSKAVSSEKVLLGVRIAVLLVAVAFIIWGITNGGARDVFIKAINICTECIGLG